MIGFYNYTVILTYMGVASAVVGMGLAMEGQTFPAIVCLMFCGLCDMFDGTVARTRERTEQEKRFGIQIDSLSDVICFGVLPAMIGYSIGLRGRVMTLILVLYVLAALSRLGYFNVTEEERQSETAGKREYYEGLPVTSMALIVPVVYGFHKLIPNNGFQLLYAGMLVAVAVAFLARIPIKKLAGWRLMSLIALGLLELAWVLMAQQF